MFEMPPLRDSDPILRLHFGGYSWIQCHRSSVMISSSSGWLSNPVESHERSPIWAEISRAEFFILLPRCGTLQVLLTLHRENFNNWYLLHVFFVGKPIPYNPIGISVWYNYQWIKSHLGWSSTFHEFFPCPSASWVFHVLFSGVYHHLVTLRESKIAMDKSPFTDEFPFRNDLTISNMSIHGGYS